MAFCFFFFCASGVPYSPSLVICASGGACCGSFLFSPGSGTSAISCVWEPSLSLPLSNGSVCAVPDGSGVVSSNACFQSSSKSLMTSVTSYAIIMNEPLAQSSLLDLFWPQVDSMAVCHKIKPVIIYVHNLRADPWRLLDDALQ